MYTTFPTFPSTRKPEALYAEEPAKEALSKSAGKFRAQRTRGERKKLTERNVSLGELQDSIQRDGNLVDIQAADERSGAMNVGEGIDGVVSSDTQGLVDTAVRLARAPVGPSKDVGAGVEFGDGDERDRVEGARGTGWGRGFGLGMLTRSRYEPSWWMRRSRRRVWSWRRGSA